MSDATGEASRIRLVVDGDVVTAIVVDDQLLDPAAVREFGDELCSLVEELGHTKIVLDCSNLQYISSAALNKLAVLKKKLSAADGQLVLCGLTPAVSEVFVVTRLNQKFTIQTDERSAKEYIRGSETP